MKKFNLFSGIFLCALLFCLSGDALAGQGGLTFEERVLYQEKIEGVYYDHRIGNKPPFKEVVSREAVEKKVLKYLAQDEILENFDSAITDEDLQKELQRICQSTKAPNILRNIFDALEGNAYLVKETLVRPILAERFLRHLAKRDLNLEGAEYERWRNEQITDYELRIKNLKSAETTLNFRAFNFPFEPLPPIIPQQSTLCANEWSYLEYETTAHSPSGRIAHTAVWTGAEMIVWGGWGTTYLNDGGRYNPATDSWEDVSTTDAPAGRYHHTAIWTGTEMLIWGGYNGSCLRTGAHYDPVNNIWTKETLVTAATPSARREHTAIWDPNNGLMVVWGGISETGSYLNTGGRYNPSVEPSQAWTETRSTTVAARDRHTGVRAGTYMLVWGGRTASSGESSHKGGAYRSNTWDNGKNKLRDGTGAPPKRIYHTAVWTGTEMIVWGGWNIWDNLYLDDGGRYNFGNDLWAVTSFLDAPFARRSHTAVWTGATGNSDTEKRMIIWGGYDGTTNFNDGGIYNADIDDPDYDKWTPTDVTDIHLPSPRWSHTAVWAGDFMLVWGGWNGTTNFNTGGAYSPTGY